MRRFCVVSLLVCSIVSDGSKPITAAVPQAKSLFPRGGQVGSTIDVTVSGKLAKGDRVRCDRPGLTGEIAEDGTKATITIDETAEPGLYWLRFFNTEGAATPVPFVVGRLPELNEAEPNGIPSKAQVVTQSAVINGKLSESADTDIFSIKVPAGRTLVAAVDANWRLGSPVDPVMQLLNEDGVVLTQIDDDRGFDPQIAWPCDQETTLLIRLFGFPAAPNSTIRFANSADYVYRLSLTTGPWPDHVQPSAAQVGEEAELNVAGWNLTDDLKTLSAKPFTSATDADAKDSPGASFSHVGLPIELPLQRVAHPVLTVPAACSREQPLTVPQKPVTVCGEIQQPGDEDSVKLEVNKGEKLRLSVESRVDGHELDAVLRIYDQDGKLLSESDDASRDVFDPVAKFTAKADGPILVSITDRFGLGDWRFAYRLHIEPLTPTVTASVKTDSFVLTPGKPLEIPVTIARNDGFAEEVVFAAVDLPEGVTCESVKSEAKGDTSKAVTLKLTTAEDAAAATGSIRIIGRYSDDREVAATADLSGGKVKLAKHWLTVLEPSKKDEDKADEKKE